VALLAVLVEVVLTVQETLVGLEIHQTHLHPKEIMVGLVLMALVTVLKVLVVEAGHLLLVTTAHKVLLELEAMVAQEKPLLYLAPQQLTQVVEEVVLGQILLRLVQAGLEVVALVQNQIQQVLLELPTQAVAVEEVGLPVLMVAQAAQAALASSS
jgi:hypothetical protein